MMCMVFPSKNAFEPMQKGVVRGAQWALLRVLWQKVCPL